MYFVLIIFFFNEIKKNFFEIDSPIYRFKGYRFIMCVGYFICSHVSHNPLDTKQMPNMVIYKV